VRVAELKTVEGGKLASARIGGHAIKVAEGKLFV